MTQTDSNGVPLGATRREWIGLAVIGLPCLVYATMHLRTSFLVVHA
jgi:hypothetical protein